MIKIGFIEYFNSLPLYQNFQFEDCEIIKGNPKQVSELLKNGEIDFAQLSAYEFLQNTDKYYALKNFCISAAKDRVASVLLISKKPLKELHLTEILLTNHSITSVQLLKILFKNKYSVEPLWKTEKINYENLNQLQNEACLLIGDEALKAWSERAALLQAGWQLYDLAKLWFDWKKLPFVFAVFAGQKDKQLPKDFVEYLENNLQTNLHNIENIIQLITNTAGSNLSADILEEYFSLLSYDLDEQRFNSLKQFARESNLLTNNF